MNFYSIRLNFLNDDEDDIVEFKIVTPQNVTRDDVCKALIKSHEILCNEGVDENDVLYGKCETCKFCSKGNECSECCEGSLYDPIADDLYGTEGRNPETLVHYTCKKYGWKWAYFVFDVDLNLD